jgi:hypothetical protein
MSKMRGACRMGMMAMLALAARQVGAQAYSVSLQVDVTSGAEQYQTNYVYLPQTSVSASQLANSSYGGPPSGSGSASSGGTAAVGSLSGSAGASGTGIGGGNSVVETSFTDTITFGVGTYAFGYAPGGGVSVTGGMNTAATAFTEASFTAGAATALGGSASFTQNVCNEEQNGSSVSCGGGWQSAPMSLSSNQFTVTQAGTYSISGSWVGEALANGGTQSYPCGNENCYNYFTATATAGGGDPHFYIEELSSGDTFSAASGASYLPLSPVPEPTAALLMLSGLGVGGLLRFARRPMPAATAFTGALARSSLE